MRRHTPWWNEEVKEVVKCKTQMMRMWLGIRTIQSRARYVEARNEEELIKRRVKEEEVRQKAGVVTEDVMRGGKEVFKLAKSFRRMKIMWEV